MSQRQDFLKNHRARISITPNQQGNKKMLVELLSKLGAREMDPSAYQVFDLEDIGFHWEDPDLNLNAFNQAKILHLSFNF